MSSNKVRKRKSDPSIIKNTRHAFDNIDDLNVNDIEEDFINDFVEEETNENETNDYDDAAEVGEDIIDIGNNKMSNEDGTLVNGKSVKIPKNFKWFTEDVWDIAQLHNNEMGLCPQQIQSYEHCVDVTVVDYVEQFPNLIVKDKKKDITHEVSFSKFTMNMPTTAEHDIISHHVTPQEARLRNLSYMGSCYCMIQHVEHHSDQTITHDAKKEWIGQFPIMVNSNKDTINHEYSNPIDAGESHYDPGGYFIVKGGEKVIVGQEHRSPNYVHVNIKSQTKLPEAEIRSMAENGKKTTIMIRWVVNRKWGKVLRVSLPFIKQDVPIGVLFCALGFTDETEIMNFIMLGKEDGHLQQLLSASFHEARRVRTQSDACKLISSYSGSTTGSAAANLSVEEKIQKIKQYLERDVLPQIEEGDNWETRKGYFLGYIVHKLLLVLDERIKPDDRDHYAYKRIETVGPLLMILFQDRFKKMVSDIKAYIEMSIDKSNEIDIHKGVKPKHITTGFLNSLKTGSWNINKSAQRSKGKASKHGQGVAQVLSRLTYMSTLSHLRRISTPSAKESQTAKPRQLHTTHWGSNCVTGDTLVTLDDGSYIPISEMTTYHKVLTINKDTLLPESSSIERLFVKKDKVIEITTNSGKKIRCTNDHPFLMISREWKNAGELKNNDNLIVKTSHGTTIDKIDYICFKGEEDVYDFTTISDNHSFIANGFVTHNCPIETPEGGKIISHYYLQFLILFFLKVLADWLRIYHS
jgi:RNA polymerase beta subunit/RNA polymerase Rpb2, domain 2/Intein splicing domain/RNA polymerase Rpb2, domain 3